MKPVALVGSDEIDKAFYLRQLTSSYKGDYTPHYYNSDQGAVEIHTMKMFPCNPKEYSGFLAFVEPGNSFPVLAEPELPMVLLMEDEEESYDPCQVWMWGKKLKRFPVSPRQNPAQAMEALLDEILRSNGSQEEAQRELSTFEKLLQELEEICQPSEPVRDTPCEKEDSSAEEPCREDSSLVSYPEEETLVWESLEPLEEEPFEKPSEEEPLEEEPPGKGRGLARYLDIALAGETLPGVKELVGELGEKGAFGRELRFKSATFETVYCILNRDVISFDGAVILATENSLSHVYSSLKPRKIQGPIFLLIHQESDSLLFEIESRVIAKLFPEIRVMRVDLRKREEIFLPFLTENLEEEVSLKSSV